MSSLNGDDDDGDNDGRLSDGIPAHSGTMKQDHYTMMMCSKLHTYI